MKNYKNEDVYYERCPSCAFANHEFELPCGTVYEDDMFMLNQDWELPIEGFFVIAPKRHIECFSELTEVERIKIMELVNKTINILKENKICDMFNVLFEEKENRHFHIWIMPRHKWMKEVNEKITKNMGEIFKYAEQNFRTKETFDNIQRISDIVKYELNR